MRSAAAWLLAQWKVALGAAAVWLLSPFPLVADIGSRLLRIEWLDKLSRSELYTLLRALSVLLLVSFAGNLLCWYLLRTRLKYRFGAYWEPSGVCRCPGCRTAVAVQVMHYTTGDRLFIKCPHCDVYLEFEQFSRISELEDALRRR